MICIINYGKSGFQIRHVNNCVAYHFIFDIGYIMYYNIILFCVSIIIIYIRVINKDYFIEIFNLQLML